MTHEKQSVVTLYETLPPRHLNSIVQKWALVGPHLTPITKTTILLHLRESSKVIYMCQIGQVYLSADEKEVTVGGERGGGAGRERV